MTEHELQNLIRDLLNEGRENDTTEVKVANETCPQQLYATISAFANQDEGGVIVFGLGAKDGAVIVTGVYDVDDLRKGVAEQCAQMTPCVRPVFTVGEHQGLPVVAAEIPPVDYTERPCYKTALGPAKGSYVRVRDLNVPMLRAEIHGYQAFRDKRSDDLRPAERVNLDLLDADALNLYLALSAQTRPNLARLPRSQQLELCGVTRNDQVTLAAVLLFGLVPQAFYPRLHIVAPRIHGIAKHAAAGVGETPADTKPIVGTLEAMLDATLRFVRENMNADAPTYPAEAVREAVLNALVHRDYGIYAENTPIQLVMYDDRIEITNPGGLYGPLGHHQQGTAHPAPRNRSHVTGKQTLGHIDKRYEGVSAIRSAMKRSGLPEPIFENHRTSFTVTLRVQAAEDTEPGDRELVAREPRSSKRLRRCMILPRSARMERRSLELADDALGDVSYCMEFRSRPKDKWSLMDVPDPKRLLSFCREWRTRDEVADYLGLPSKQYALRRYLDPLIRDGVIELENPASPRAHKQRYHTVPDLIPLLDGFPPQE